MYYYPSQDLAEILIDFGFKEKTKTIYPNHFFTIQKNGYNPDIMKRVFTFGNSIKIYFDYNFIKSYKKFSEFDRSNLNENELKSILVYCRMSYSQRNTAMRYCQNILNIINYYLYSDIELQSEKKAKENFMNVYNEFSKLKFTENVFSSVMC